MDHETEIHLDSLFENRLTEAVRRRLPFEACGIIYGTVSDGIVTADDFCLFRNRSTSLEEAFAFDPEEWVSAYFQAHKNRREIVGLFHTHPNGSPLPSESDKRGSIPWATYWIIGLSESAHDLSVYRRNGSDYWINLPLKRLP
ncbi:M67 family metallopeptidase [Cohnella terricola]|uniref:M67 family metallopeptidase n=1 Tax=Cohnella terricola TaxID=1289167 RepID=A0A559JW61_9BACL|nr:M67 family metallopeptidase [Cohnella terricola]TVY04132.1 M67 family metallopeptidase [Cohnella terricola]